MNFQTPCGETVTIYKSTASWPHSSGFPVITQNKTLAMSLNWPSLLSWTAPVLPSLFRIACLLHAFRDCTSFSLGLHRKCCISHLSRWHDLHFFSRISPLSLYYGRPVPFRYIILTVINVRGVLCYIVNLIWLQLNNNRTYAMLQNWFAKVVKCPLQHFLCQPVWDDNTLPYDQRWYKGELKLHYTTTELWKLDQ